MKHSLRLCYLMLLFIVAALSYYIGYSDRPAPQIITRTVTIPAEPQIIEQPARIKYVPIPIYEASKPQSQITQSIEDSVLVAQDTTEFQEGVLYDYFYHAPLNRFKHDWRPNPREKEIQTIYIEKSVALKDRKELWAVGGLLIGVTVGRIAR